ncbi:Hypothetical predicted protein, partial [Marmota monax]
QSEEEEDVFSLQRRKSSLGLSGYPLTEEDSGTGETGTGGPPCRALRRIISIEEDPLPQLLGSGFEQPLSKCPEEEEASEQAGGRQIRQSTPLELTPTSPRGQPVGKEALYKVFNQLITVYSQMSGLRIPSVCSHPPPIPHQVSC